MCGRWHSPSGDNAVVNAWTVDLRRCRERRRDSRVDKAERVLDARVDGGVDQVVNRPG
jgi:hypothetical protein